MYRIIKAEELAANIYLMDVEAPRVAKSCQPGQFVIVRISMTPPTTAPMAEAAW